MRRTWGTAWAFWGLLLGGASQLAAQDVGVALVTAVSGQALVRSGQKPHAAQVLEWLPLGARLETSGEGRLRLVMRSGRRYELAGRARAVVGSDALRSASGARELAALPAWPAELLAPSPGSGANAAAVRIRSNDLAILSPRAAGWALAGQDLEVRFERPPSATSCDLEIQDRDGSPVGRREPTDGDRVRVPAGALRAGESYECVVTCRRGLGPAARGAAGFRTLSPESARGRDELLAAADQGDADAALFGVALERELDQTEQARTRLRAALAQRPEDASLQAALARAESWR